ncbi:MAG TPA: dihydrolipoyl dehydrogenase, partial [Candidatus Acidoferrales bacterium]|nr:dihydrolipoyl dehydrogenase [Candidatus Acidoferrales bacterium]
TQHSALSTQHSAFDLIVIGSGPGGYVAAIRAAQLGMRVACIEKDRTLGGTCLNIGCIPSKALLDSSEHYHTVRDGLAVHGIKVGAVELDLPTMMTRKERVVKALTQGVAGLFKKNKVERIVGSARFTVADAVEVTNGDQRQTLRARRVLIATGSAPVALPGLPFDGERIICSTEALSLKRVPERMLVIGGGAIGLEMGSVWNRLGARVHVVEFMDRIVPGMDRKMGEQLQRALEKQGMTFQLQTSAKGATIDSGTVRVTLESGGKTSEETCDVVLVAVGRRPFAEGLGAREIGVAFDERGRIKVDEHYATNVPGIYAIGDVIAGPMLAHKASEEGIAAVELMAGQAGHVNYDAVPNVVYTWPELASVGMSEEQAQSQEIQVRIGTFPFIANGRARCMNETEGMVKILADAKTDRVIGVHILGPRASDLIAEAALVMEFGGSAEDIARSVHAHPTLPEAIKEAALAVHGRALHV